MVSRYINDSPIREGKIRRTASAVDRIRESNRLGLIQTRERILKEGERLDQVAGQEFGDASMWWVICATSNIGWHLQAPPGTVLQIPVSIADALRLV